MYKEKGSNMNFKAIIFDLDGVICFTDEYHYRAWKALADRLNAPFDRTINNRLRGVSRMASLEIILETYTGPELSEEEKVALATEKNEIYRESLKQMSPADQRRGARNPGCSAGEGPEAGHRLVLEEYPLHSEADRPGRLL